MEDFWPSSRTDANVRMTVFFFFFSFCYLRTGRKSWILGLDGGNFLSDGAWVPIATLVFDETFYGRNTLRNETARIRPEIGMLAPLPLRAELPPVSPVICSTDCLRRTDLRCQNSLILAKLHQQNLLDFSYIALHI